MKILYAAGNNYNSSIQLMRFITAMQGKPYQIKIAAYNKFTPVGLSVNWSLDCMYPMSGNDLVSTEYNDNLATYYDQVKYYAPDLIISDLEYFTSYIANDLNITLWQCSSSLINYALEKKYKYNLGVFSRHFIIYNRSPVFNSMMINMIDNSNCNFVYSHFADTQFAPTLVNNFEWIRPYYNIGKASKPCKHNIIAALNYNNKKILNIINKYDDVVVFTPFNDEKYNNLVLKNINDDYEYFCNIKNCNLFISEGQTSFLADAFYNRKYSIVYPNMEDFECIVNSAISEKIGLSTSIYQQEDISIYTNKHTSVSYNEKVVFLHEKIEQL